MALPLAACLAVLLAFPARAQNSLDAKEFKAKLSRDFSKGVDLAKLDAAGQDDAQAKLLDQAKYVQAGKEPGDEQETYETFIRSVARRLGANADAAVELYKDRVRPARSASASKRDLAARASIAADVKKNPGISAEKKARLAKNLETTSEYLKMGLSGDANFVGAPATKPVELNVTAPPAVTYNVSPNPADILPRVQPYPYVANVTPAVPIQSASKGMMSWEAVTGYFDWERGKQVAVDVYNGTLDYVKKMGSLCYRFVKQALIDAGVIDAPNPQSTAVVGLRPTAAKMFNEDVKKNPKILDAMGYRQVDLAKASDDPASVPDGSLLIYAAGCSFADAKWGHSELTVSEGTYTEMRGANPKLKAIATDANEVRVCHFACTKRSMPFLRTYGKKGCLKMYVPVKSS